VKVSENYLCQVLDRRSSSSTLTSGLSCFDLFLHMHIQIMRILVNR